ncbi:Protein of unknown function [Gryllus bimaculatus]|nr:Protein of unknown function [Gryllus bimaculatus]
MTGRVRQVQDPVALFLLAAGEREGPSGGGCRWVRRAATQRAGTYVPGDPGSFLSSFIFRGSPRSARKWASLRVVRRAILYKFADARNFTRVELGVRIVNDVVL